MVCNYLGQGYQSKLGHGNGDRCQEMGLPHATYFTVTVQKMSPLGWEVGRSEDDEWGRLGEEDSSFQSVRIWVKASGVREPVYSATVFLWTLPFGKRRGVALTEHLCARHRVSHCSYILSCNSQMDLPVRCYYPYLGIRKLRIRGVKWVT